MNRTISSKKHLNQLILFILLLFTTIGYTQYTNPWMRQNFIPIHPRHRKSLELRLNQSQGELPFQRTGEFTVTDDPDTAWVRHFASGLAPSSDAAIDLVRDGEKNIIITGYSVGFLTGRDILTVKYDSDGNQLWTARYNGPANIWDDARAVEVDDDGNVYVTGLSHGGDETGYDFVTLKYDPQGIECWVQRYDGTGNDWDEPHALVVHNNSITVTGESAGLGTYSDYLTIQYDTQGNEIFTARYNGSMSGWDIAHDAAVDDYNNVYVTGQSWDLFTDFNFLTIKYDSTGNLLWTSSYNGSGNNWDVANAIALDKDGNPIITGSSYHLINGFDMVTIKYDTAGNEIWTAAYTGPVDNTDAGYAMSLDDHGNTYITGLSQISGTDYDCMTIRIDSLGNIVWTELYDGPGSDYDAGYELTVNNSSITVTGPSQGIVSDLDYAVIRYDSSGAGQWIYRYDGPAGQADSPYGIIVDDDEVIVTGGTRSTATLLDYTTIRLDGTGNEMWVSTYTGPGHALDDALALGIDHNGNIIVTGTSSGPQNNLDIATVLYDSLGTLQWISRYNGPGNGDEIPHAMVLDKYEGIYITGESMSVDTEEDMITIKYSSDGEEIWSTLYNGPGNGSDKSLAVAADTLGNCVVTGESSGSGTKLDAVTIKYGPAGDALWTERYNGGDNNDDRGRAVVIDGSGNVTIAGTTYNPTTFNDFLIIRYNSAGHEVWTNTYDGPGGAWDTVYDMVQDKNGNIHITGPSRGSGTDFDYATIKYDAQGQELWVARYDGPVNAWDEAYSLAVDTAGNVIVTGESQGLGTNADYTTIKYDSNGNELWVVRYNGPINDIDAAYDLTLDDEGLIYVTGESRGVGTLADFTTIKYSSSGEEIWTARYDGPGNNEDIARAVSLDVSGNVVVAGVSVYPLGISSVYTIVKYSQEDTTETYVHRDAGQPLTCKLHQNYPNPFNPTTIIPYSLPEPGQVTLNIYNLRGERIMTLVDGHKPSGQYTVVWKGKDQSGNQVASGIYLVRLESGEFVQTRKMLFVR